MILSRADILARKDLPTKVVPVPEWGGDVVVRTLTAGERDEFEIAIREAREEEDRPNVRARLVALVVVGEDGRRLFSEADVEQLGELSARAMDRVFAAAQRLSGFTPDDVAELEKN